MSSSAHRRNTLARVRVASDEACRCPLAIIGSIKQNDYQNELNGARQQQQLRPQEDLANKRRIRIRRRRRARRASGSERSITEGFFISLEEKRRTRRRGRRRSFSILRMARQPFGMQIVLLMLLPLSLTFLCQTQAAIATNSEDATRIRGGQYNSKIFNNENRYTLERRPLSLIALADNPTTTSAPPPTTTSPPAPDFAEPIGNQTVAVGRDAQLSCRISNLGNFRPAWLRVEDKGILTIHNNVITRNYRVGLVNDDEGKNFMLTIKNVQPSDKGGYMCQINSLPMKYAVGYLDVLTPPAFVEDQMLVAAAGRSNDQGDSLQQPTAVQSATKVTVGEGSNATLFCKATGHPAPLITWRREDNEPILISAGNEMTKIEGSSLTLSSVNRLHSGAYLCIASNGVQPAASKRQVLDVQFSPVIRLAQTELGVQLGQQEAKLLCYVELNPLGSYHWVKLAGTSSSSSFEAGARIEPQQQDDQSLIDQFELVNSDKFEIVIKGATGSSIDDDRMGYESSQQQGNKIEMSLTVRHIERKDLDLYKCIAKNALGIQSNSIRLYESSSFSLNSMFRGGISHQTSNNNNNNNNNNHNLSPDQLNDQADSPAGRRDKPPRAHTRSSWLQRPTSGRQLDNPQQQADYQSSKSSSPASLRVSLSSLLLLFCSHLCLLLSLCFASSSSLMKAQSIVVVVGDD